MSYFDEKQSDMIQKANYYNEQKKYGYNKYETSDRDKIKIMNLTERELDHAIFSAVMDAQNQLLSAIMPRLKEIDGKQSGLFNVMNQVLEDNRNLMEEIETVQRRLQIIEKADD